MLLLTLGLALWVGAHLLRRLAPRLAGALGRVGIAALIGLGLVLMVLGYRGADAATLWVAPVALVKFNNVLMLGASFLFAAAALKTALTRDVRHPMLWGVVVWAGAHLMVNGDAPSLLLFGGLGLWALVQMGVINHTAPVWTPPPQRARKHEVYALLATFGLFLVAIAVHYLLGLSVIG